MNAVTPGDSSSVLVRTDTDDERGGGEDPAVKRSDALKHNVHSASSFLKWGNLCRSAIRLRGNCYTHS